MSQFGPEYPKINSCYKRDQKGRFLLGEWSLDEFAYLADNEWTWTEKVDGTNIRVHCDLDALEVNIGGRTDKAQIPAELVNNLQEILNIGWWEDKFEDCHEVTIYGEGYGPKIQKGGGNYRDDQGLIVFDVLIDGTWLKREDVIDVAGYFGLDVVPEIYGYTLNEMIEMVATNKLSSAWPKVEIEGFVGRPAVDLFDRKGHRLTVKVKGKDFK